MTVQQVVDLAKNGKLKNLAVKDDTEAIVGFINLGLIELYKRFMLSVKEYMVELQSGVTDYAMPDDYMWIVSAYEEVVVDKYTYEVVEIPVNVEDNERSINTAEWNKLQIPLVIDGGFVSVIYVAAPEYLTSADLSVRVPVPPQMIEALLEYVAYEANNTFNDAGKLESDSYYQHFEASCARIEQRGMLSSDDLDMESREMKGFV